MTEKYETNRKIFKPLRRDAIKRINSLMDWVPLLLLIDPEIEAQFKQFGLDRELLGAVSKRSIKPRAKVTADLNTFKVMKAKSGQARPLKFLRRQIRQDFDVLFDELKLLRQLDPSFESEMNSMGLGEAFNKLKNM